MKNFIVFEGTDGAGKTTLINELLKLNNEWVHFKGIGSETWIGKIARKLPSTFIFLLELFYITEVYIKPSISKNKIILQDRYVHSIQSYHSAEKWYNQIIIKLFKNFLLQPCGLIYLYVPLNERVKRLSKTRENKYHDILVSNPIMIEERDTKYDQIYKEFDKNKIIIDTKSNNLKQSAKIAKTFIENINKTA